MSSIEGGPYSVLEALASGTPCVVTDVGFCRDLINGKNGYLLEKMPEFQQIKNAIKSTWYLKDSTYNVDLLNGRYTWQELSDVLYGN